MVSQRKTTSQKFATAQQLIDEGTPVRVAIKKARIPDSTYYKMKKAMNGHATSSKLEEFSQNATYTIEQKTDILTEVDRRLASGEDQNSILHELKWDTKKLDNIRYDMKRKGHYEKSGDVPKKERKKHRFAKVPLFDEQRNFVADVDKKREDTGRALSEIVRNDWPNFVLSQYHSWKKRMETDGIGPGEFTDSIPFAQYQKMAEQNVKLRTLVDEKHVPFNEYKRLEAENSRLRALAKDQALDKLLSTMD